MAVKKRSWSRLRQHRKIRQKLKKVTSALTSPSLIAGGKNVPRANVAEAVVAVAKAAVATVATVAIGQEPVGVAVVAAEMVTSKTVPRPRAVKVVVVAVAIKVATDSAVDVAVEIAPAMTALLNRLKEAIIRALITTTAALKILMASKARPARNTTRWIVSLELAGARRT